jgi:RNA polymerase sigma factor (sigma-70 family)
MALLSRRNASDAAFERLYERHVQDVYRYSLGMLGAKSDAEDVTQTTFLNAYTAYQRGVQPEKPQNWLMTIAHNVCRQRFRQAQRRPLETTYDDDIAPAAVEHDGPSAADLKRALSELPPNQRAALVMRELEGRSYAEIAEVLSISTSALETLIFRARQALREQLDEQLTCSEAAFAISKAADGRLSVAEQRSLRAHVRACDDCMRAAQRERATRRALKSMLFVPLPQSLATFAGGTAGAASTAVAGAGLASGITFKAAVLLSAGAVVGGGAYVAGDAPVVRHSPAPPLHALPVSTPDRAGQRGDSRRVRAVAQGKHRNAPAGRETHVAKLHHGASKAKPHAQAAKPKKQHVVVVRKAKPPKLLSSHGRPATRTKPRPAGM